MNAIKEIVEWLKEHPKCTVDDYFRDVVVWSLEKDEWQKMTDEEKRQFEQKIRSML